tara:strand:+ start:3384 stop:3803 length:420 start_codon:yes stop_codon:yes gene_type:complete
MEKSLYHTLQKAKEDPYLLSKDEIKLLKDNDLDGFTPLGGQAKQDTLSDLAAIGAIYAGVKTAPIWGPAALRGIASDWSKRTLSRDAWLEKTQFGIEPKGLQGWRPLKSMTPEMLKTGPTGHVENAVKMLGIGNSMKNE